MTPVALDTETTGTEGGSRPIEIALCYYDADNELQRFESLINPEMPMPHDLVEFHENNGISLAELTEAPTFNDVMQSVEYDFLPSDAVLIIHNAKFDVGIVDWEASRHGLDMSGWGERPVVCTLEIAKELKETKKNSLTALRQFYGIETGDAHRAMADAWATLEYIRKVLGVDPDDYISAPWDDYLKWIYTSDLPDELSTLPQNVEDGTAIYFQYEDKDGNQTERTITPYGWCEKYETLYVHGYCHTREARREFRADRMSMQPPA